MASLVEQIFMQAQAGSAQGQGFADFYVQGKKLGQQQQQIDLQKQQVAAELAQLPLKQTLLRQDAQMNALKIEDVLKTRQMLIDNERFLGVVSSDISNALSEKDPYGAFTHWSDAASVNPKLLEDPRFMQLRKMVDDSVNVTTELMRAEAYRNRYEALAESSGTRSAIDSARESRLREEFEFRKQREADKIPQHRQSEFRAKARIIENDINLIGNTEEKLKRLNDLVREFEATTPGASTMPKETEATSPKSPFDVGRFKVTPIR